MASDPHLDEEDDFGGDYPGSDNVRRSGDKRSFGDLDEEEDDVFGQKKGKQKLEESGPGATTGMILSLRESLQNYKDKLATCQADLGAEKSEVQKWCSAFQNEPAVPAGTTPEPAQVVNYLRSLKSSEESVKEQLEKAKKREAALIVAFAKKEQEIADLKSALRDLKAQLKPSSIQARRLLLDPAIHEEFTRLKNLNEEKEKKVKELEENAKAVNFTPQSKMGKMLMAKCRTLQEENEEIGAMASEGKIHELGMKLALQKSQNAELRSQFEALYKQMEGLTHDVERSSELVLVIRIRNKCSHTVAKWEETTNNLILEPITKVFVLQEKLEERECEIKRLNEALSHKEPEEKESTGEDMLANDDVIPEEIKTEPA